MQQLAAGVYVSKYLRFLSRKSQKNASFFAKHIIGTDNTEVLERTVSLFLSINISSFQKVMLHMNF